MAARNFSKLCCTVAALNFFEIAGEESTAVAEKAAATHKQEIIKNDNSIYYNNNHKNKQYQSLFKYGVPSGDTYHIMKDNLVVCFDSKSRNARWVLERLNPDTTIKVAERKHIKFFEDKLLEPRFRSKLNDYYKSGYDRGHLAAAANHSSSESAMHETFNLCNISPQIGEGFNRDYWARFESFCRKLARKSENAYIVTGPLFIPTKVTNTQDKNSPPKYVMKLDVIGTPPEFITVPNAFFKVIVIEKNDNEKFVAAFVMPNTKIDRNINLTNFLVPIYELESLCGFKFFPHLINNDIRDDLDNRAYELNTRNGQFYLTMADTIEGSTTVKLLGDGTRKTTSNDDIKKRKKHTKTGILVTTAAITDDKDVYHLCDFFNCKLPESEFWLDKKNK